MGKRTIIFCDHCGTENNDIVAVSVTTRFFDDIQAEDEADLCMRCRSELRDAIRRLTTEAAHDGGADGRR